MDRFIDSSSPPPTTSGAKRRSTKQIKLSFDEWNVWYQPRFPGEIGLDDPRAGPLIEDVYNVTDAVVVGSLLITLLRHADRVPIACQAQLVNVIAPIRTEPGGRAWRQTIFHPFALTARYARGDRAADRSRRADVDTAGSARCRPCRAPRRTTRSTGDVALFVVNRSETDSRRAGGRSAVASGTSTSSSTCVCTTTTRRA